jgi:hypothetical protein
MVTKCSPSFVVFETTSMLSMRPKFKRRNVSRTRCEVMFLCVRGMQMLSCSDFSDLPEFPDFLRLPSTLFQPGDDADDDAIVFDLFDFTYYCALQ